jgi:hypothetical protein
VHGEKGQRQADGIAALPPAFVRSGQEEEAMSSTLEGERQMKGLLGPSTARAVSIHLDNPQLLGVRHPIPSLRPCHKAQTAGFYPEVRGL